MNAFRVSGLALIACGVLLLVLEFIQGLISSSWQTLTLAGLWAIFAGPGGLMSLGAFVQLHISAVLWQNVLQPILLMPAWAGALILGFILLISGRTKES
jgi:hypothetical protein